MNQNFTTIGAPLYLLESSENCWKCRRPQKVIALATPNLADEGEGPFESGEKEENEPFLLLNITDMPQSIFELLSAANPRYKLYHSRAVGAEYYANICECGANFGDFYLFSEPGHAFFPMSVEEASRIAITQLPLVGTFELRCGWELGGGEFIFKHGIRR